MITAALVSAAKPWAISYHHSGAPLFWEFMFFKAKSEWQVYIFRFNDQFDKVFANHD